MIQTKYYRLNLNYEKSCRLNRVIVIRSVKKLRLRGGNIIVEPCVMEGLNEFIAFVLDPDGYRIELVQSSMS